MTCNKKWIVYNNLRWPAQWLDQEAAPKHCTKPKLHQKKVTVTVGWSAAHPTHDSFLDPRKTITMEKYAQQTNETHRKPQHLQPAPVNWKGPILHDNTWLHVARPILYLKVERTGLRSFALSTIFTWPLAKLLPLFQASRQPFAGKTLSQPAGGRKCFPRVCWIPKHGFLCFRNKSTYFSLAKMCWL